MISLEALTKDYGETRAVNELSVDVHPGRVTGFLGPNGAGKSATMRMILGLDAPTSGRALVNGQRYGQLTYPMHTVGAHISGTAGHPGHTPRTFLHALARSNRIPEQRVDRVLEESGLATVAAKRIGGFSLGMRQRLGISAALLGDPDILILDEPMNGLDAQGITWIRQLMRNRAENGGTVFVSSHLMSEVQQVADHLILIGRGRLIADATTEQLIRDFTQQVITVRSPQVHALADLLERHHAQLQPAENNTVRITGLVVEEISALALSHGIELHELSSAHGSLEAAYNQLTLDSMEFAPTVASEELNQ